MQKMGKLMPKEATSEVCLGGHEVHKSFHEITGLN
jgi:hypothetical protein